MDAATYQHFRTKMAADPAWSDDLDWQENVTFPDSADVFANQLIWVILNSGMKSDVARLISERVYPKLRAGQPIYPSAFRHVGKCAAIEHIWKNRADLHSVAAQLGDTSLVEWCGKLPWIGNITKFHAAKNLGADVAKPDRWLERVAKEGNETVDQLCERLSLASGDRKAVVDLVIWWACAHSGYRPQPTSPPQSITPSDTNVGKGE